MNLHKKSYTGYYVGENIGFYAGGNVGFYYVDVDALTKKYYRKFCIGLYLIFYDFL